MMIRNIRSIIGASQLLSLSPSRRRRRVYHGSTSFPLANARPCGGIKYLLVALGSVEDVKLFFEVRGRGGEGNTHIDRSLHTRTSLCTSQFLFALI